MMMTPAALIYVIDSNDIGRISLAAQELHTLINDKELQDIPILIFGRWRYFSPKVSANKQDLPHAKNVQELANELGIYSITRPWHIQACCAPEGGGLLEGKRRHDPWSKI
jgi:hypothetical protein